MLSAINVLRGIASILVFFAHYRTISLFSSPNIEFFSMGAYGVDIFFVISGFVICVMTEKIRRKLNKKNIRVKFFLSRVVRIIFPLWVAIVLQYFVVKDYSGLNNFLMSIALMPSKNNYYGGSVVYYLEPQWSLLFEMFFYLSIIIFISNKNSMLKSIVLIFSVFVLSLLGYDIYIAKPIVIEFLYGILSYQIYRYFNVRKQEIVIHKSILLIAILLFFLCAFSLRKQAGDIDSLLRVFSIGLMSFFVVTICAMSKELNKVAKKNALMNFLGDISFSLYLLHMVCFRLYEKYFVDINIFMLGVIIVTFVTSFYYLIDKPCHKLSRRLIS